MSEGQHVQRSESRNIPGLLGWKEECKQETKKRPSRVGVKDEKDLVGFCCDKEEVQEIFARGDI